MSETETQETAEQIIERLTAQLDDRKRQQEKADEYASLLNSGRKRLVELVQTAGRFPPGVGGGQEFDLAMSSAREACFKWLEEVRTKLTEDFGAAIGAHFNLGKYPGYIIGKSEPREHEARLLMLDKLILQMRAGELSLKVR